MQGRVMVLGIPIDRMRMEQAVDRVYSFIKEHGFGQRTKLVMTPNPEIIFAAQKDQELKAILISADLAVPDGTGVVWAARVLGQPVEERVTGIDLMMRLLRLASDNNLRVFFLGTRPETLKRAVKNVQGMFPGAVVAGSHHGYFSARDEVRVVGEINRLHPDILFVGMGAPREQRFMMRWREKFGVPVAMGVGGSFDVLGGDVRRAPSWMIAVHLEWFFRLIQQPSRWRRMLALPRFAFAVLREAQRGRPAW